MKRIYFDACYDNNNFYHYMISLVLTLFVFSLFHYNLQYPVDQAREWAFWVVWAMGWAWEFSGLFKPSWSIGIGKPTWKLLIFHSSGFSAWDVFVPDLIGCLVGIAITWFIWL